MGFASHASAAETTTLNWYRGNTHTHSVNSDGNTSPDTIARWYKEHGYQFLFITDHEYFTDPAPLNAILAASERFILFPGQEVTQWSADPSRSAAHVNSLFTTQVIWPVGTRKCTGGGCGATVDVGVPLAETFAKNIAAIRAANGIAQVNHPNYRWSVRPEDLYDIPDHTLLEIWNGLGTINNLGGATENGDARPSAEGYWDVLLSRGKIIYGVGSDDAHDFGPPAESGGEGPGHAWIVVRARELSAGAIQQALRSGDFYASTGISLEDVSMPKPARAGARFSISIAEARQGASRYLTRFVGTGARVLAEVSGTHPAYTLKGDEGYVRASIVDSNGRRAWTQPVFTDARQGH